MSCVRSLIYSMCVFKRYVFHHLISITDLRKRCTGWQKSVCVSLKQILMANIKSKMPLHYNGLHRKVPCNILFDTVIHSHDSQLNRAEERIMFILVLFPCEDQHSIRHSQSPLWNCNSTTKVEHCWLKRRWDNPAPRSMLTTDHELQLSAMTTMRLHIERHRSMLRKMEVHLPLSCRGSRAVPTRPFSTNLTTDKAKLTLLPPSTSIE